MVFKCRSMQDITNKLEDVFRRHSYHTNVEDLVSYVFEAFDDARTGHYNNSFMRLKKFERNKEVEYLISGVKGNILSYMNADKECRGVDISPENATNFQMECFLQYLESCLQ